MLGLFLGALMYEPSLVGCAAAASTLYMYMYMYMEQEKSQSVWKRRHWCLCIAKYREIETIEE